MPTTIDNAQTYMKGVFKGFGGDFSDFAYDSPDYDKLAHLERNVYQFSGAKNWQQLRDLTDAAKDTKTEKEFLNKALTILDDYQGRYLKTERNAAIAGSQMASKWVDFEKHPNSLIQYRTVEDARVRLEHQELDRITRRVDDPFWSTYYPPNGWNCRCTAIRINEGTETPDKELAYPDIPKMFRVNLGQEGLVFPKGSPYFIGLPKEIQRQSAIANLKVIQKDTIERLVKGNVTVKRKELPAPIQFSVKGIKEAMNQPHAHWEEKNQAIRKIDDILKTAKYLGSAEFYKENPMISRSHFFSFNINKTTSWAIVNENKLGEFRFYSVSDSKKVLKGINKKPGKAITKGTKS